MGKLRLFCWLLSATLVWFESVHKIWHSFTHKGRSMRMRTQQQRKEKLISGNFFFSLKSLPTHLLLPPLVTVRPSDWLKFLLLLLHKGCLVGPSSRVVPMLRLGGWVLFAIMLLSSWLGWIQTPRPPRVKLRRKIRHMTYVPRERRRKSARLLLQYQLLCSREWW